MKAITHIRPTKRKKKGRQEEEALESAVLRAKALRILTKRSRRLPLRLLLTRTSGGGERSASPLRLRGWALRTQIWRHLNTNTSPKGEEPL